MGYVLDGLWQQKKIVLRVTIAGRPGGLRGSHEDF